MSNFKMKKFNNIKMKKSDNFSLLNIQRKFKMKKGQGLVPSTLIGWIIAVAFLALMVFIAVTYKDKLALLVNKILDLFRFGR